MNSNIKTALITAIYGKYDRLLSYPEQDCPVDGFCFSDNPDFAATGWTIVSPPYPRKDLHPRLRAKFFRMLAHREPLLKDYNRLIWLDASIQIDSPQFVSWCLGQLGAADLACFRHSTRTTVVEEAEASRRMGKYLGEPIQEQLDYYAANNLPAAATLFATGIMVRKRCQVVDAIMEDWWLENLRFSYQDQISLPYVLWQHDFKPKVIEENIWENPYSHYVGHRRNMRERVHGWLCKAKLLVQPSAQAGLR